MTINEAIKEVKESVQMTYDSQVNISQYLATKNFDILNNKCKREISLVYSNIFLPTYMYYSGGDVIPNIFAVEDEDEYGQQR